MAITTAQYEIISRFLDGAMDMEDMDAFEAELLTNPEMRKQLDFELFVKDGLAFNSNLRVKSGPVVPENQPSPGSQKKTTQPKTLSIRVWLATGAAAAIILALSILFLVNRPTKEYKPVATSTTQAPDSIIKGEQATITGIPVKDSTGKKDEAALFNRFYRKDKLPETYPIFLADAFTRYEAGDYTALQQLNLSGIPETRGSDALKDKEQILQLAHYYKGISYLETGNTAKAILHFDWVLKNKPARELLTKTEWYLALACLQEHEQGKAKELLKKVLGNSRQNKFSKDAKALLSVLEN